MLITMHCKSYVSHCAISVIFFRPNTSPFRHLDTKICDRSIVYLSGTDSCKYYAGTSFGGGGAFAPLIFGGKRRKQENSSKPNYNK